MKNKNILLFMILLSSSFIQAYKDFTLNNGTTLRVLELDDSIRYRFSTFDQKTKKTAWHDYTYRIGDFFFFPQNDTVSFEDFIKRYEAIYEKDQKKCDAFEGVANMMLYIPGSKEDRTHWKNTIGKPFFSHNPDLKQWFIKNQNANKDTNKDYEFLNIYRQWVSERITNGTVPTVIVFYEGYYYTIHDINTPEEAVEIFNKLLEENPETFLF